MTENNQFYTKNLSFSQLTTFVKNTWEWQNQRILWKYDNTISVAGAIWTICHKFVEKYLKNGGIEKAIEEAYQCVYDGSDGFTYIIDIDEVDPKTASFEDIKDNWKTKVVNFGKTGSNKALLDKVEKWINAFVSETIDYGELLHSELEMEYNISEKLWNSMVHSPLPFKCIADEVCRTTSQKAIMIDWEMQMLEPWVIFMEDTKFKDKYTEMNVENPLYIFQAFFTYYCVKMHFWEAPKYMIFREIKTSQNKDGSSQHQTITIPFFWKTFELYKVFFWRYIAEFFERMQLIQERDLLFNIFDFQNGIKEWKKQKAYYMKIEVWELQSQIAQTSRNKQASNVPMMWDRDPLKWVRRKKWEILDEKDLYSVENKIRTAFMNFWIIVTFEKKVEWYSFDQYLFTPYRGITMSRIKSHLPEIIQALEVEKWLRIEAPVLWTKFIGVEIPKEERKIANLPKVKKAKTPIVPIGVDVSGKKVEINLSDPWNPHMIVAGQTGSGKSVFLWTCIESLKDKWNLHLIDPKRVEFSKYKKIAKNYIVDCEDACVKLSFLLQEMYMVYNQLEEKWYKDINEANKKLRGKNRFESNFIIVDEFASLVHDPDVGKEIIKIIWQLVNLGRAAGYHVIIATQRPDIKVIPGNIKANISTRVCFQLADKVSSKVVLDEEGAENLLGKWDMLFRNEGQLQRLQGFYI